MARFVGLLQRYGYSQYVDLPTHVAGHTLDLVISRPDNDCIHFMNVHDHDISDHFLVICDMKPFSSDFF